MSCVVLVKMGVEKLHLFIRFCNMCGLLPYRMRLDFQTKRFKRFDGNWRHPANYWFTFLLIIHIIFIFYFIYLDSKLVYGNGSVGNASTVHMFAYWLYFANLILLLSTPRLFLIQFRHLETALETLHHIDRVLLDKVAHLPCTTRKRSLICIILICCTVSRLYLSYCINPYKVCTFSIIGHTKQLVVDLSCNVNCVEWNYHVDSYEFLSFFLVHLCHLSDWVLVSAISPNLLHDFIPYQYSNSFYK